MMWLEATLLSNRFAHREGARIDVMEPFAVEGTKQIGLGGSGADFECEQSRGTLVELDGAIQIQRDVVRPLQSVAVGGITGPLLRVMSSPKQTCGWPSEVPFPLGAWGDDVLSVLGDSLLEKGYAVGAQLQQVGVPGEWFSLALVIPPQLRHIEWRRGVMQSLRLEVRAGLPAGFMTWSMGKALAAHALCKPLSSLELVLPFEQAHEAMRFLSGAASVGLPCLETLTCRFSDGGTGFVAMEKELRAMPGLKMGFPALRTFSLSRRGEG